MNNSVKVSTSLKVNNYIKNLNLKDMNNHQKKDCKLEKRSKNYQNKSVKIKKKILKIYIFKI